MTVPASSSGTPETVPTDGTYIEGTITPVAESSFSGDSPAGFYPFTLSDAGLVQMHFITHANQVLRIKVIDADENQLLDAWLDSMASPGDITASIWIPVLIPSAFMSPTRILPATTGSP